MQNGVLGPPAAAVEKPQSGLSHRGLENAWGVFHRLPGAGGESPINVWHDLESVLTLTRCKEPGR